MPGRPAADLALDLKVAEHAVTVLARRRQKMPLTVGYMQAIAQQGFNHKVGQKRAARMIHHLRATGRLTQTGSYKSKAHGFFVTIYRLAAPVLLSVRRKASVKGKYWWEHGLFGNPDGEPPLYEKKRNMKRWKSKAHRALEFARAHHEYPAPPPLDLNLWEETT